VRNYQNAVDEPKDEADRSAQLQKIVRKCESVPAIASTGNEEVSMALPKGGIATSTAKMDRGSGNVMNAWGATVAHSKVQRENFAPTLQAKEERLHWNRSGFPRRLNDSESCPRALRRAENHLDPMVRASPGGAPRPTPLPRPSREAKTIAEESILLRVKQKRLSDNRAALP
jgi:hypothetical protein